MQETTNPDLIAPAPWQLQGSAIALFASPFILRLLVHYKDSPVGPYDEHALGTLTRRGPHIFQMSVTSEASMRSGRANWGFPKFTENLQWHQSTQAVEFRRGAQIFRFRPFGPHFGFKLNFWTAQQRDGVWLKVPGHIQAQAQCCWRGRQLALLLNDFQMEIEKPQ